MSHQIGISLKTKTIEILLKFDNTPCNLQLKKHPQLTYISSHEPRIEVIALFFSISCIICFWVQAIGEGGLHTNIHWMFRGFNFYPHEWKWNSSTNLDIPPLMHKMHNMNTNNISKFYFGQTTAHSIEVLSLKIEVSQLLDLFVLLISVWHLQISLGKKKRAYNKP